MQKMRNLLILSSLILFGLNAQAQDIYANSQSNSATAGTCTSCSVANPDLAVDGDNNTHSTIQALTAVVGGEVQQTLAFPSPGVVGDTVAFLFEVPYTPLLTNSNTLIFNSFSGGASNAENYTVQFRAVVPSAGGKFQFLFFPNNNFDSVQVILHVSTVVTPLAGADSIFVYSTRIVHTPIDPLVPSPIAGCENPVSTTDSISATCLGLCGVENPEALTTSDLVDFTTLRISPAILNTFASVRGYYADTACSGDTVVIILANAAGTLDSTNYSRITVNVYLGSTQVSTETLDGAKILANGGLVYYTMVPGGQFNSIEVINTSGLLNNVEQLRIYQMCLKRLSPPVPNNGREQATCYNTSISIAATPPPGAVTRWYDENGTFVFEGDTLNTPNLTDTAKYYLESFNPNTLCVSQLRDSVVVNVYPQVVAPNDPQDTVWICYNRTASIAPQPVGSIFNFYRDAAGTDFLGNGQVYVTDTLLNDTVIYVENTYLGMCNGGVFVPVYVKILPDPFVADIADTLIYCLNSTVNLTITEPTPGITYRWYDGSGNQLYVGNPYPNYNVVGFDSLFIESVFGACTESPNRKRVDIEPIDQAALTVDVDSPVYICDNDTAIGEASIGYNHPKLVVEWFDAFGAQVKTGNPILVPTPNDSVSHYATAHVGNCPSLDTAKYTVINISTVSDQSFDSTAVVCFGNSAVLTSNIKIPGAVYTWYDFALNPIFVGDTLVTGPITTQTVFYFEISNVTCLNGIQRHPIVVQSVNPPNVVVADKLLYVCTNDDAVVSASTTTAGAQISWWNAPTGGAQLFAGADYTFRPTQDSTLVYAQSDIDQCASNNREAVLVVRANNIMNVTSANDTICEGQVTNLFASSRINGADYSWWTASTGGTRISTGNPFLTPTLNTTTSYYVQVEFTGQDNTVCSIRPRTRVTVVVDPVLDSPVVNCGPGSNTSVSFQWADVPNAVGYQISLDGGATFMTPNNNLGPRTHQVNGLNPDSVVTAIVRAIGGRACQTSPNSNATSCVATNCLPNNATLDNILVNLCDDGSAAINVINLPVNYRIQYNGGTPTTSISYSFGPAAPGEYTLNVLVYIDGQIGCDSVHLQGKFVVYPSPTVTINAIALSPAIPGGHVNTFRFEADGSGMTNWSWNFGDGNTSTVQNPTHSYANDGEYQVTVYVRGALGCDATDTLSRLIAVTHVPDIFIPNTFTPNGDKKNDFFGVFGQNITLEMMKIFNDYGNIVFESNDLDRKWDGTYNGDPVPSGTYYYTAIVRDAFNQKYEKQGTITVIRK